MTSKLSARILDIVKGTTVDGPGFRTSIYFAGCAHGCVGCHNRDSWDFNAGENIDLTELLDVIKEEDFDVTLSGGDPLYQPQAVKLLCQETSRLGYSVWIYTGYRWEEIVTEVVLREAIESADVLVDSPFEETQKQQNLRFKGSANQRIIDIKNSLKEGEIILWED